MNFKDYTTEDFERLYREGVEEAKECGGIRNGVGPATKRTVKQGFKRREARVKKQMARRLAEEYGV